ncbi:flagellar motor protein PomA, partial [Photobacterium halotolerans]|nr:flagellar motor protein PomA [Photobacterium halotolerans]
MDLATLIGLVGAFAFVIMAMLLGGSLDIFFNVPSILIVLGGTLFVVLMKYSLSQFFGAAKIATKAFMFKT